MNTNPLTILASVVIAIYIFRLWHSDLTAFQVGNAATHALPGATPSPPRLSILGILGALLLVGLESAGEYPLELVEKQSDVSALYLLAMVGAGIIEEIVFRGYLVVEKWGRSALVGSIMGFSLLFALIHFHWIRWKPAEATLLEIDLSAGTIWWTSILFLNSLWFYWLRFNSGNPNRSLIPCFAAHIASNLGVFAVKLVQGHVVSWV